jgi:hypothetical protein
MDAINRKMSDEEVDIVFRVVDDFKKSMPDARSPRCNKRLY